MAFSFGGLVNGLTAGVGGALRGANTAEAERYKRKQEQDAITRQALQQALLNKRYDEEQQYARQRDTQARNDRIEAEVRADQQRWGQTILSGVQPVDGLNTQGRREQGYENKLDPQGSYQPSVLRPAPKEFAPPGSGSGGASGLQQSQLVDGEGRPLVFNKNTGKYEPAVGDNTVPFRRPTEMGTQTAGLMPVIASAQKELAGMENPQAVAALVARPKLIGNFVTTKEQRRYNAALKRYLLSVYAVSGKAFPEGEWERLQSTFGYEPGDDEQVIADKALARETFVAAIMRTVPPQYRDAPEVGGAGSAPPATPKQGKGRMSPAAYDKARKAGYTDADILADGWTLP